MNLRQSLVMSNHNNQLSIIFKADWDYKNIPLFEASYDACVRWCERRNWVWTQE